MNLRKLFGAIVLVAIAFLLIVSSPLQAKNADNKIEQSVRKTFVYKTYLKKDAIKVNSDGGVVSLTGTVASETHKSMAEETVAGIAGVTAVNNQLVVIGQPKNVNSDEWIGERVRGMMLIHHGIDYDNTTVLVNEGKVTLKGNASSKSQKELATECAREVAGVKGVDNQMTVPEHPLLVHKTRKVKLDDASISSQVRMALQYRHGLDPYDTRVTTRKGVVTLSGTAVDQAEINLATKRVMNIRGVKDVDNRMTIGVVQSSIE